MPNNKCPPPGLEVTGFMFPGKEHIMKRIKSHRIRWGTLFEHRAEQIISRIRQEEAQ